MQIQVNAADFKATQPIVEHVNKALEHELKLFADWITRVEVHLHDANGPKAGVDKRCVMEARLAKHNPLAVEHTAPDLYEAITEAAGKLGRAIRHRIEKQKERRA